VKLKLGLPKGSLQDATLDLFRKAGFVISAYDRSYTPRVDDPELEVLLMRAQEIPRYVHEGVLDAGISGHDWICENEADVVEVAELLYSKNTGGSIRLVLAVAQDSDIHQVEDLQGKRIATELVNTTKKYLAEKGVDAAIEYSWGATEVKVPKLVDAISELTETGNSLRANNLRIIATILESTTRLHANKDAWADPWKRQKLEGIAVLLEGALRARSKAGLKMNVPVDSLDTILGILPAMKQPSISQLVGSDWVAIETILDEIQVRELIPELKAAGAQDIIEYPLSKVIP